MVGGGQIPKPGEVSLANNGVLFLDELPEFKRNVLEVLRQPIEDGSVTISRAISSITYPASIMLVCAMNPCPWRLSWRPQASMHMLPFADTSLQTEGLRPLLDRIDIHVEVPAVPYKELSNDLCGEHSTNIRSRVQNAKAIQIERFNHDNSKSGSDKIYSNAKMRSNSLRSTAC